MVTFRSQQWSNNLMTSGVGQGADTYKAIKAQNQSCGTNTGMEIVGTFFSLGANIAQVAMTQKTTEVSAEQKAMTKATGNVATDVQNYSAAKIGYENAEKELKELEDKKADSSSDGQSKIQKNIDDLEAQYTPKDSNNAKIQAEFQKYSGLKTQLKTAKDTIDSAKKTISENQALASQDASGSIGNSGLSVNYGENNSGSAVATLNGGKTSNPRYNKPDPNDSSKTVFLDGVFQQDLQIAQQMDQKNEQIKAAKKNITDAQTKIKNATQGLEGVTAENIDTKFAECEQKLSELGQQQLAGSDGKSMSVTDFNSQKDKLNDQLKTAKDNSNNADLDKQIAAKKKEVTTKKASLDAKKDALITTRDKLQAQINQMNNLNSTASIDSAKTGYEAAKVDYKNAKSNNKSKTFLQKIFGGGKSKNEKTKLVDKKDAKAAYKQAKANHRAQLQAFQSGNGYSANASNIALLQAQIDMINKTLGST